MIMGYTELGGEVRIPQRIKDIFFEAFYGSAIITSIIIPVSISDITPFVFEKCEKFKGDLYDKDLF